MALVDLGKLNCLIDLHLHLDGSLSLNNVKQLAALQNIVIPENDEDILNLLRVSKDCPSLNEYLKKFDFPLSLLQTKQALTLATKNLLSELQQQGLQYVEIRMAPVFHLDKGLSQEEVVEAVLQAIHESELKAQLILCLMRQTKDDVLYYETIDIANKYKDLGVCAIDLAGPEARYATSEFVKYFEYAKSLGVKYTIHTGEADGELSIQAAIDMGTYRIGHGVLSYDNEVLLQQLKQKQIPLELCYTSNLHTRAYTDPNTYPIKQFMNSGVLVTINTDNMSVSNTNLVKEYTKLMENINLSIQDIKQLLINSANAAFVDDKTKQELINNINTQLKNL